MSDQQARPSVTLPSIVSHLLQLLRGECCHLGSSLLQSPQLYWTQDCVSMKETDLRAAAFNSNYIICTAHRQQINIDYLRTPKKVKV